MFGRALAEPPIAFTGVVGSRARGRLPGTGATGPPLRGHEAPPGRRRAAGRGLVLRLPAAAERRQRAGEADAAGRAHPGLHAGGESGGGGGRWRMTGGKVEEEMWRTGGGGGGHVK